MSRHIAEVSASPTGFHRISGLAAVGFALMIVLANLIVVPAGQPTTGTGIAEVSEFFAAERDLVGLSAALTPAAWVLATLFGAGSFAVLWPAERRRGEAWSLLGMAGLLLQNATFAAVVACRLALATATTPTDGASPWLWALHDALFTLNGTFLALALVGLSVAGLRAGLLRPWQHTLGLGAAALLFTSATLAWLVVDHAGPLGLLGLAGWLMWVVWLIGYGITLYRLAPAAGETPSTA
ncbi:2-oxoglutarate/malate transporter [Streptomyces millisiae]|uniref:2-oxoglutarate/malate transporter n=1 Tax=Streptomyces millisiae TaxID=3075542 RepID=A0ABU2LX73_9ACTN|nr:2-oxoglutarate/malate transporter [Streptomyces sp. DSM 44918]MDT0321643.1 2-oxoglutarate/malate transporter [Streptomyces sp. DSM 44918]